MGEGMLIVTMKVTRNEECVSQVITKYADMVLRLALLHLKNRADAEDVFQDVFAKLFDKEQAFNDEEHLKAWLIRCTTNRCKNLFGSYWFRNKTSLDSLELPVEDKAEGEVISCLTQLPVPYRTVIYLYYYEGYSSSEIAEILGTNDVTVRTRLKRGRAMLKQKLQKEGLNQ